MYNHFTEKIDEFIKNNKDTNKKLIVGLSGKKRSGKTYFGQYLEQNYGFTRIAFADRLKELLKTHFDLELVKPEDSDCSSKLKKIKELSKAYNNIEIRRKLLDTLTELFDYKIVYNFINTDRAKEFISMIKNIKNTNDLRQIYQYFGSDICRYIDNDIWIKEYDKKVKNCFNNLIVTDDIRFYNEYECIKKYKHLFIYVENKLLNNNNNIVDTHISERVEQLKSFADFVVNNNYSKKDNKLVFK